MITLMDQLGTLVQTCHSNLDNILSKNGTLIVDESGLVMGHQILSKLPQDHCLSPKHGIE